MGFDGLFKLSIHQLNEWVGAKLVLRLAGLSLLIAAIFACLGMIKVAFFFSGFTLAVFWGFEYAYALQGNNDESE